MSRSFRRWSSLLFSLLWGGMLSAVAAEAPAQAPETPRTEIASPIDPNSSAPDAYRLRSGDLIELRVYQEDDLNAKTRVDAEGFVLLPLIGRVAVRGETVAGATRIIRTKLEADYLYEARASVLLIDRAPERFLMLGQVAKPGVYELPSGEQIDLLRAIAMAGGFTKIASPGKVLVKRTTGGVEEFLRLNAKTMNKTSTEPAFYVRADDQITVGESAF